MFLIKLGGIVGIVAVVLLGIYYIDNYKKEILEFFQKIFPKQSKEEETMKDEENSSKSFDVADSSSSRSVSPTKQFEQLKSGSFVEFTPNSSSPIMKEFMVTGTGVLLGCKILPDKTYRDTGDKSPLFILDDGKYFVIKLKDGRWVAFNEAIELDDESANEFKDHGVKFTQQGQVPGSYKFTWRDMPLSINSVGYMKYHRLDGDSHLADQMMVKFMVATRQSDNAIFYLENVKVGTDRVWIGTDLGRNLDQYLGQILAKE